MIINDIVNASLSIIGKTSEAEDYASYQRRALDILKIWIPLTEPLYSAYTGSKQIERDDFDDLSLNGKFAYGEPFAPLASTYIAMILSPEISLFRDLYTSALSELRSSCSGDITSTVQKY